MKIFTKIRRPFSVTLFFIGGLSFTLIHFSRFIFGLDQWEYLLELEISSIQYYFLISGFLWALAGIIFSYQLWFRKKNANVSAMRGIFFYLLYFWIEQIFIMNNPFRNTNWIFMFIVSTIFFTASFWVLNRPTIKNYFGDINE